MNLIKKSIQDLNYDFSNYCFKIEYSNRFSPFNANIKKKSNFVEFNLSSQWKDIGEEIKMGLIQSLIKKMFKLKGDTLYIELYNDFVKKLDKFTPIIHKDEVLEKSFNRVNEKYFNNLMDIPNLKFGKFSTRQIGLYNFQSNTVTISSILKEYDDVIDFVMYHELLHKKEKFERKDGRHSYHNSKFRDLEKKFENCKLIDEKIKKIIREHKKQNKKIKIFKKNFLNNWFK